MACLQLKDVDIVSSIKASSVNVEMKRRSHKHSPVDGGWASLGFAAKHHLPVPLQGFHRIHDAAGLLGENRTLQDTALCRMTSKDNATEYKVRHGPVCKTAN